VQQTSAGGATTTNCDKLKLLCMDWCRIDNLVLFTEFLQPIDGIRKKVGEACDVYTSIHAREEVRERLVRSEAPQ
jgi:hypothetical protein